MVFIPRSVAPEIARAARRFPALILTGPRRAGKTTLLRRQFPRASYWLMEDPDVVARVRSDPRGFLAEVRTPALRPAAGGRSTTSGTSRVSKSTS